MGPQYYYSNTRVFAENFGWVRFVVVRFLYKTNPNPPKNICCGQKSGPRATFNPVFLGLGWPWVGEFVGFIIIFYLFSNPTEFRTSENTIKHTTSYKLQLQRTCPRLLPPPHVPHQNGYKLGRRSSSTTSAALADFPAHSATPEPSTTS